MVCESDLQLQVLVRSQNRMSFVQVRNRMRRRSCSGHLFVCSSDSAVRSFDAQKIQANAYYCCVWRREETRQVHFARPRTQAFEPALTHSLAAKGCAEALHVASEPSTMTAACCVLSYDTYQRKMRTGCAALLGL